MCAVNWSAQQNSISLGMPMSVRLSQLPARFGSAYDGDLSHWQYETFRARWAKRQNGEGSITFTPDGNGRIAALQLLGNTFTRIAPAR